MKLVQVEPESSSLRRYLRRHGEDERATSELALMEVVRAVLPGGAQAVEQARRLMRRLYLVPVDRRLLDAAGVLAPGSSLRSLDAIHLASARRLEPGLRAVVTYDRRMTGAAVALGLLVESPGGPD